MKLKIAQTNTLEVLRAVPMGLILGSAENEVLIPTRYVPSGASPGDLLDVFVYTDSEDRPIATTETPLAQADEFASLRVVSTTRTGAFLDWGLPKDLLLPFRSQLGPLEVDDRVVVRVLCDRASGRPVATAKVEGFLEDPPENLRAGQEVDLLIYETTDLGSKAIVDGRYGGLLYHDLGRLGLEVGTATRGYIQQVRADGKIDLTQTPSGKAGIDEAREKLIAALDAAGGRIELSDRSDPDEIRRILGLSKKAFKRAVGTLYRERRIRLGEASIEWVDETAGSEADEVSERKRS